MELLYPRLYELPKHQGFITILPLTLTDLSNDLILHLHSLLNSAASPFNSFPSQSTFQELSSLFLSHHLFIAFFSSTNIYFTTNHSPPTDHLQTDPLDDGVPLITSPPIAPGFLAQFIKHNTTDLGRVVAGMYQIKPNSSQKSHHCCNAGFIVDPSHRGKGVGLCLGKSYLHYAPRLGFKISIFDSVYVTNTPAIRMCDRLQFVPAGILPKAARVNPADVKFEEYVDIVIYWREFLPPYLPKSSHTSIRQNILSVGLTDMGRLKSKTDIDFNNVDGGKDENELEQGIDTPTDRGHLKINSNGNGNGNGLGTDPDTPANKSSLGFSNMGHLISPLFI